jgi:hypothetical protein
MAKQYNYPGQYVPGRGRVRHHVRVVEETIGRRLRNGECVHHVDGDIDNNARRNLVACQDSAYHHQLHRRQRALRECGHADWLRCRHCGQWDAPHHMHVFVRGGTQNVCAYHTSCNARVHRAYLRKRRAA